MSERTVPPTFREVLVVKEVKKLSLRERLRLILGYNLLATCKIVTQHKVGHTRQKVTLELTDLENAPQTTPEELEP